MLGQELGRPIVKSDQPLRLWCLAEKGYTALETNPISAKQAWQEAQMIAHRLGENQWEARAKGELGILAFLEGDSRRAATLGRAQPSSKHRKQSGGPLDGKGHRFLARLIVVGKSVKTTPRFSGLVEARVWSQCLRASRRRAFSDSRPAATQACPRCAFQSIAQSAGRRR